MRKSVIFLALIFSLSFSFSQSYEEVKNILLKNTFSATYTLDCESIEFKEVDGKLLAYITDSDFECGDDDRTYIYSVTINGNKISIKGDKHTLYNNEYTLEGLNELPSINYRYRLISKNNGKYNSEKPKINEKVQYDGYEFALENTYYLMGEEFVMYCKPDENSDFYITERLYSLSGTYYQVNHHYVSLPGICFRCVGELSKGNKGSWLCVVDDLTDVYNSQEIKCFWIFVPNSSNKKSHVITETEKNELSKNGEVKTVSSKYSDLFLNAVAKYSIKRLSDEEKENIEARHWFTSVYEKAKFPKLINNHNILKVNETLTVQDNLRLRKSFSLSDSIITTLKKGSKVKILEIGRKEVIEDSYSSWTKVQVVNGFDKNGKPLPQTTEGWVFGGFLEK